MKKFFTIVASAILVGASAFAITWEETEGDGNVKNLAKGATVTISSVTDIKDQEAFTTPGFITDGNDGTRCNTSPSTHKYTNDWVLIDLGSSQSFTDIQINWDGGHCKKYSLYVLSNKPTISDEVAAVTEGDDKHAAYRTITLPTEAADVIGGNESDAGYTEKIVFETAKTGQYILIYSNEANNNANGWGMGIWEVRVANIANHTPTQIKLSLEKTEGLTTNETNKMTAEVLDQYGDPIPYKKATIKVGDNEYTEGMTFNKGEHTVTASFDGLTTVSAKFTVVADQDNYIANAKVIEASEDAPADYAALFDGGKVVNNWGANYELDPQEGASEAGTKEEHYFVVRLPKPYTIDMIALLWEGACADYDLYVSETLEGLSSATAIFTATNRGQQDYTDRIYGNNALNNARFIKVVTNRNATGYGIKLHDMKIYGTTTAVSNATKIEAKDMEDQLAEQEITLNAKVIDQFDEEMTEESANIKYSCSAEGVTITGDKFKADHIGNYSVTATYGDGENAKTATFTVKVTKKTLPGFQLATYKYCTMILPFAVSDFNTNDTYNGYKAYSVSGYEETKKEGYDVLTFTEVTNGLEANKPYILFWDGTNGDGTRTFLNGYITNENDNTVYTNGWLKGVMVDTKAPAGSYVLQYNDELLGFYHVAEGTEVNVPAYHAYLQPTTDGNEVKAFVFNMDGVDAIENIATSEVLVNVYDLNGVVVRKNVKACEALQNLKKGIYIVNGAKKAVK